MYYSCTSTSLTEEPDPPSSSEEGFPSWISNTTDETRCTHAEEEPEPPLPSETPPRSGGYPRCTFRGLLLSDLNRNPHQKVGVRLL